MKSFLLVLFALGAGLVAKASEVKTEDQLIDEYLSNCEDFLDRWRGQEVNAAHIIKESDAYLARCMELFREMLKKHGAGHRDDLVASKGKMFESWRKQRAVFLRHLADKGVTVFRYDGGKNQPFGYVLLNEGKPFRLLSIGIHRPDPNLGDVGLPFPISGK